MRYIWFHVVLVASVHFPALHKVEHAIRQQVDTQVEHYYKRAPIRFGNHGIPVRITNTQAVGAACNGSLPAGEFSLGCHSVDYSDGSYHPWAIVDADPYVQGIQTLPSTTLDHEVIETVVDPELNGREICDPVEWDFYRFDGVLLSDWVKPGSRRPAVPLPILG